MFNSYMINQYFFKKNGSDLNFKKYLFKIYLYIDWLYKILKVIDRVSC